MLKEEVRDRDFWIVSDHYNNFDKLQCVLGEIIFSYFSCIWHCACSDYNFSLVMYELCHLP